MKLVSLLFRHHRNVKHPVQPTSKEVEATIEGRRYRVDTAYLLPKDDKETNRLDFQHHALKQVLGVNYKAPIDPNFLRAILDVGAGTGRWAVELAREYPQARIAGFDLEVPTGGAFPHNCVFYGGDLLQGLPFPGNNFDYVHQRLMVGAIPAKDWPNVIRELLRVTRMGGWVELLESGQEYHNMGPSHVYLQEIWQVNTAKSGFDLSLMPKLDKMFIEGGLRDVKLETIHMPLGKWAGRAGELMGIDIYNVYRSFKPFYVAKLGMKPGMFDEIVNAFPGEWEKHHTTYDFYVAYGQK